VHERPHRSGHQHVQRARAHAKDERQVERIDLAVGCHQEARVTALDAQLDTAVASKVAGGEELAEERAQREKEAGRAARRDARGRRKRAGVELLAQADHEAFHLVDVVADEDERRARRCSTPSSVSVRSRKGMAAQHCVHRPQHRVPLAAAEAPLLLFAQAHDGRVEADARVVDEHAAVHLADVDRPVLAAERDAHRGRQVCPVRRCRARNG
jgi:hypothetical protein